MATGMKTEIGKIAELIQSVGEEATPLQVRLDELGKWLAIGALADITIFDPDCEWVVNTADFASRGRHTPLAGSTLTGRVMATISQGKLVYKDDAITLEMPNLEQEDHG